MKKYELHVATLISNKIHEFVTQEPTKGSHQSKVFDFPALITTLGATNVVVFNPTVKIRPSIERKFIDKHWMN